MVMITMPKIYIFISHLRWHNFFLWWLYFKINFRSDKLHLLLLYISGYPLSQQLQPSAKQFHKLLVTLRNIRLKKGRKKTGWSLWTSATMRFWDTYRTTECLYRKEIETAIFYTSHIYGELKNEDTLKNDITKELR